MGEFIDWATGTGAKRKAAQNLENYNNTQADLYAERTRQQFGDLAADYASEKADGLGNAQDWLDPSMKYQQQAATDAVTSAYGNQGKLFGSAARNALSDRQQAIASQGWQQALNNYMNQQGFNNSVNQQNFGNNFQTASMLNQADATRFNTATQGRANVASIQGPSLVDGLGMAGKAAGKLAKGIAGGMAGGPLGAAAGFLG